MADEFFGPVDERGCVSALAADGVAAIDAEVAKVAAEMVDPPDPPNEPGVGGILFIWSMDMALGLVPIWWRFANAMCA